MYSGKTRVVGADVERVVQIHALLFAALPDPGRGVRRESGRQLALPLGELREHCVYGRMLVLQREELPGQAPQRARGGDRLCQWLLAVSRCGFRHGSSSMFRLCAFLANLYRIAILYG